MTFLALLPVALSTLVLAAHFLRMGALAPVVLLVVLISLLALRQWWVPRLFQVILVLGGMEWLRTLFELRALRAARNEPSGRMTGILVGVAAFTLLSAALFEIPRLRRRFRRDSPQPAPPGGPGQPGGP